MAFDRTKPADTDYISASAANLRENFRALAEDTRLYGTGAPESSAGQNGWRYVDTATGDEYLKVNNAWIKKTDLADLIRGLFLGTVSEDEGIPTGAIIESGSNANGEYIKFANGMMVCHGQYSTINPVTTTVSTWYESTLGNTPVYYSSAFIDSPAVSCSGWIVAGIGTGQVHVIERGQTYCECVLRSANNIGSDKTKIFSYLAIGRWF